MSALLGLVRGYYRYISAVNQWLAYAAAVGMFVVVPIILFEVVSRYFFSAPTEWAMESASLLFGPYFLLAGPWLLHIGGHVTVDIVHSAVGDRARLVLDCFGYAIVVAFCWVLADVSWPLVMNSWALGETSFSGWNPPIWWTKFFLPAALVLLALQAIGELLRQAVRLGGGADVKLTAVPAGEAP